MWELIYNKVINFFQVKLEWFDINMPVSSVIKEIGDTIYYVWNYKLLTTSTKEDVMVYNIVISIVLLVIGLKLARSISNKIKHKLSKRLDISTSNSWGKISYYFLIALILLFILDISNVPVTVFAVIGTTFALSFGLGAQHIANNFFSGLMIMAERPINLGDIVEIKGQTGEVIELGTRCITIRTNDNIDMIVPNSNVVQEVIINHTNKKTDLRNSINFKIENSIEMEEIDKIILTALDNHPSIQKEPMPKVLYKYICKKYYEIEVEFYLDVATSIKHMYVTDGINRVLADTLKKHNISMS